MAYCSKCGQDMGARYICPRCGALRPEAAPPPPPLVQGPSGPPKKPFPGWAIALIVISGVFLFFFVIGLFAKAGDSTKEVNGGTAEAAITAKPVEDYVKTPNQTNTPKPTPEPTKGPKLELLESEVLDDGFFQYIVGKIRNNTDRAYRYVQVDIKFYEDDTLLGNSFTNVTGLGPGEIWEFKAPSFYQNANRYVIDNITGR